MPEETTDTRAQKTPSRSSHHPTNSDSTAATLLNPSETKVEDAISPSGTEYTGIRKSGTTLPSQLEVYLDEHNASEALTVGSPENPEDRKERLRVHVERLVQKLKRGKGN
ncbi:MAG: hypothetical protein M1820_001732 [Bogoriella megaspora]|nr:MAG: hypothetical protein M1820_001732 [Bogoriella megaspora]